MNITATRRDSDLTVVERAADEAFVFGYPLVLMGRLRAHSSVGAFTHERPVTAATPAPEMLRSSAWLDAGDELVVLSVPDWHGRYYVLTLVDMWAHAFASLGPRTTGTGARRFAIGGPRRTGDALPPGVLPISAPTDGVRIAGQTRLGSDPVAARRVQDGLRLQRIGGGAELRDPGGAQLSPAEGVAQLDAIEAHTFLSELDALLVANPPPAADRPLLARLRTARVLSPCEGREFSLALERGLECARARIHQAALPLSAHALGRWRVRLGARHHADHLARAAAAYSGLETTTAGDEVSASVDEDRDGRPLHGDSRYELRFDVDRPPPVHGFWSLAAYGDGGCRARLGSDDGLTISPNGALTVHVQPRPPVASEQRPNWLAIPAGPFRLVLRLFWPTGDVLAQRWTPPALTRVG
jgi:hypothetical protein